MERLTDPKGRTLLEPTSDYRWKGKKPYNPDAYKASRSRNNAKKNKSNHIIAVDGEGVTDPDTNKHRYILLAARGEGSEDHTCVSAHELSTIECFEFLLGLPAKSLKVGFSFSYDVEMMLVDLDEATRDVLYEEQEVEWKQYYIRYLPKKRFSISDETRSTVVWDCFGFFQSSFVDALEDWKIGWPEVVYAISDMKDKRGSFTDDELESIEQYCSVECWMLTLLMRKLLNCCKDAGLTLTQYSGAGSIASAIFVKHKVREYLAPPPEPVFQAGLYAYFGGRFDNGYIGIFEDVWAYDIRSAYPAQIQYLPCLKHVRWIHSNDAVTEFEPHSLYHVTFNFEGTTKGIHLADGGYQSLDGVWTGLPVRIPTTQGVVYPNKGTGWYWGVELTAAQKLIRDPKSYIKVIEAWKLKRLCDHQPFSFVPDLYAQRQALKAKKDHGQLVLKLGLNSLYGKMAQSVGKFQPPYQSFLWAGMTTAGTRAQLLDVIRQNPEMIIGTATDSIHSRVPLTLDIGTELGQWEAEHYKKLFIAKPGVYRVTDDDDEDYILRTRGFGPSAIDFDEVEKLWLTVGWVGKYTISSTRFFGYGSYKASHDKHPLRQWAKITSENSFGQATRLPSQVYNLPEWDYLPESDGSMEFIPDWWYNYNIEHSDQYKLKADWETMFIINPELPKDYFFDEINDTEQPD